MATKKLDSTGLSQVWAKIVELFATKAVTEEINKKLGTVAENAQVNVIESVKVNGVALDITDKAVNVVVPTGTLANLSEVDTANLSTALANLINGKATKATTLSGYGITDAYTKTETDTKVSAKADKATTISGYGISDAYTKTEVDSKVSSAVNTALTGIYKVKGSSTFANLPTSASAGDVYNVTDAFTTTSSFVEGTGKSYPAGTNVVYTDKGWDCMAGVYDFSEYLKADDIVDITSDEIDKICVINS